jgi:hypothetical protein
VGSLEVNVNRPASTDDTASSTATGAAPGDANGAVTYTITPLAANAGVVDVCALPGARRVLAGVDDQQAMIPEPGAPPIPFPVRFYDTLVTPPFTVSSNGWMSFLPNVSGSLSGTVPNSGAPNMVVAGYWRDLFTRATGICYAPKSTGRERLWVVQWQDAHFCCSDDPSVHLTFEVTIHEARNGRANNVIDVTYSQMDGASGQTAGAGIEDATGAVGIAIPGPFTAPRAFRFTPSR